MKNRFYKSSISLIIILIIVLECIPLATFASYDNQAYIFTYSNGESVEYYVDSEGHEYVYINGEKRFILLPLEKYRVSDEKLREIEIESESIYSQGTNPNNELSPDQYNYPTNYSQNLDYVIIKTLFNSVVNLSASTGYLNYPGNSNCVRVKTTECKPWYANDNVNIHFYYIQNNTGNVYDYHYFDIDCSSSYALLLSGSVASQINVGIVAVGAMTSCRLAVTATAG